MVWSQFAMKFPCIQQSVRHSQLRHTFLLSFPFLLSCALIGQTPQSSAPPQSSASPTQRSMGSRKHYVGLPNFGEVAPNLFRGGQPGVDGLKTLKQMGVSIVIDMRSGVSEHEKNVVKELGMQYVAIPWHCPFPNDAIFVRLLKVIDDNRGKKIFVHCRLGDDRTGMAIASYRMAEEGWSADDALKEMEQFGFDWRHHMICPTLEHYEQTFPDRLKNGEAFKDWRAQQQSARPANSSAKP